MPSDGIVKAFKSTPTLGGMLALGGRLERHVKERVRLLLKSSLSKMFKDQYDIDPFFKQPELIHG